MGETDSSGAKMRNLKATLRYDGTDFAGWQVQPGLRTVQGSLMEALERITRERTKIVGAGRTDAGVHALGQAANFKTSCDIPAENLRRAINSFVGPRIRIDDLEEMPDEFDARKHARSKLYRYTILIADFADPFLSRYAWQMRVRLDVERMRQAAQYLVSTHDFTSFRGAADESRSSVRTIYSIELKPGVHPFTNEPIGNVLLIEVCADGFLHKMARNIVGTLVQVGTGKIEPTRVPEILAARDRQQSGPTAPARGLCLVSVEY